MSALTLAGAARRSKVEGVAHVGHIGRVNTGQCHGTIRMADGREVWFHRGDMRDGTAFNALVRGDAVAFELLDDRISGARALAVRRTTSA